MGRKRMVDTDALLFDNKLVKTLGPVGVLAYIRLWALAEDFGGYEADPEDLALQMGALNVTPKRMQTILDKLVDMGKVIPYDCKGKQCHWIRKFMDHQNLTNSPYPKLPVPPWITWDKEVKKGGRKCAKYEVVKDKSVTSIRPVKKKGKERKGKEKKEGPDKQVQGLFFDSFWKIYPRKEAKKDARKAWDQIKKPSEPLFNQIISSLKKQNKKKFQDTERKFIPLPATWIRGQRWEDETSVEFKPLPEKKKPLCDVCKKRESYGHIEGRELCVECWKKS